MYFNKLNRFYMVTGLLSAVLIASGSVNAVPRDENPGYASDSVGNIVRSGAGDCVRVGSYTPEMATTVGCDGVTLDVEVEIIKGAPSGIVTFINFPATALFAFDSAELSDEGKNTIDMYRSKFDRDIRSELEEAVEGIVIGHTDSTGNADYNLGLSLRRAESVRDYLVSTGTAPEKLRVLGRGLNDPIASNDTDEGRALNRRVEVVVVGELRALDAMRFPSVALFPRRSAELTEQGKQLIAKNRLQAEEQLKRAVFIEIIGHTDDVGDDAYNMELSEQRAQAMRDYLVDIEGVDPSKIVTTGAGETMPIASNQTKEGRAENRRVEILVLGRVY